LIAPFIIILPDLTLKQLWYNMYPTPTQSIKIYEKTPEMLRILGSERKFIKDLSSLRNDFSQKIEIVNIEENSKLFKKRNSRILESMKMDMPNPTNYKGKFSEIEKTKSPLNPVYIQGKPLIKYLKKQEKKNHIKFSHINNVEELQSDQIDSINYKRFPI